MISIVEYNHDRDFSELLKFCEEESKDRHQASENMWNIDWEISGNTLPYILVNLSRFYSPSGQFYLLYDDERIIGCGGVYISDFSSKVAIVGARTWINRDYRKQHLARNYLLTTQRNWAISMNIDIVALTFNYYNISLIRLFRHGQSTLTRTREHMFFNNINYLPYPVLIQNVPQTVVYEKLNTEDFMWESIKADQDSLQTS